MNLTTEESEILEGKQGKAKQKAMEILVALGKIYDAKNLIPVSSVQIAGVSYKNLGEAGLEFLTEWANDGAKATVPTTLNPAGMDLDRWQELGFKEDFAGCQQSVISAFQRLGIAPVCSCTPYLIGSVPRFAEHIAWAESSAISFANSVLGARTNREGGPSALAATIIGKTANYGLHLPEERKSKIKIEVSCPLRSAADFGAMGYLAGKKVSSGIPYFTGIQKATLEQLKALGAAMAASGAVALYHIDGITPEAMSQNMLSSKHETILIDSLVQGYQALNSSAQEIDMVSLGCPHCSIEELKKIASLIEGRKLKTRLWITAAAPVAYHARRAGLDKIIEQAGGQIVSDTCMIVAPIQDFGIRTLATNSAKAACYAPHHCNIQIRFGDVEQCIQAAISGRFPE